MAGPAAGWTKWFFYPGFTAATGGLLREPDLPQRQARFDRSAWLAAPGHCLAAAKDWFRCFATNRPRWAQLLEQLAQHGLDADPAPAGDRRTGQQRRQGSF